MMVFNMQDLFFFVTLYFVMFGLRYFIAQRFVYAQSWLFSKVINEDVSIFLYVLILLVPSCHLLQTGNGTSEWENGKIVENVLH